MAEAKTPAGRMGRPPTRLSRPQGRIDHPQPPTRTHTPSLSLAPFLLVFATASTPMTSKRFHARTRVHLSLSLTPVSLSCLRSFAGSLRPGVCTAARNVRGSSISAAREFDGAGRVAGHAIIERLGRDERGSERTATPDENDDDDDSSATFGKEDHASVRGPEIIAAFI